MCRSRVACGVGQITGTFPRVLCPIKRGASRSSRTVGCRMRWTLVVRKDERASRRTAKSCGPDASTLASRRRDDPPITVTKSPIAGESTKETVKPVAQGRPGVFRWTCGGLVSRASFARGAAGALGTRLSLRPLVFEGQRFAQELGQCMPREGEGVCFAPRNDAAFPGCGAARQRCAADPGSIVWVVGPGSAQRHCMPQRVRDRVRFTPQPVRSR